MKPSLSFQFALAGSLIAFPFASVVSQVPSLPDPIRAGICEIGSLDEESIRDMILEGVWRLGDSKVGRITRVTSGDSLESVKSALLLTDSSGHVTLYRYTETQSTRPFRVLATVEARFSREGMLESAKLHALRKVRDLTPAETGYVKQSITGIQKYCKSPAVLRGFVRPVDTKDGLALERLLYKTGLANGLTQMSPEEVVCVKGIREGTDPDSSVISVLRTMTKYVRPVSACTIGEVMHSPIGVSVAKDTVTGRSGIWVSLSGPTFLSDGTFAFGTTYLRGALASAGWRCSGRKSDTSEWVVTKCSMVWIS